MAQSVLLFNLPALFLFSQQGKDLLQLVVFLAVIAEVGLQGANNIDGAVILQRQLVVEDPV